MRTTPRSAPAPAASALALVLAVGLPLFVCAVFWYTPRYRLPMLPGASMLVGYAAVRVLGGDRRSPGTLAIGACFGFYTAQHITVLSFIPLWLVEHRGYSLFAASAAAAIVTAVNVIGNLLAGWGRRHGVPGK